jgi:hypothetical protein
MPEPPKIENTTPVNRRSDRQTKRHLGGWFIPAYYSSLRLIQAKYPDRELQSLISEALNDLFTKYNVPNVKE